jgi:glycerol-3-phosphate dehydrogenase
MCIFISQLRKTKKNYAKNSFLIIKDGKRVLVGAHLRDELTGNEWDVKAKAIINATGPFTDHIRKMDDQDVKPICSPSSGTHIVLPGYYR